MELHVGPDAYSDLAAALVHARSGDTVILDVDAVGHPPPVHVEVAITLRAGEGQRTVPPLVIDAPGPVSLEGLVFGSTDASVSPCAVSAALYGVDAVDVSVALCVLGGEVSVVDSAFSGTGGVGGLVVGGEASFERTAFSGWTAGSLAAVGSTVRVLDSSFLAASAAHGAGIVGVQSAVYVRGTTFHGLSASGDGGAMVLVDGDVDVSNATFDEVSAERGGAMSVHGGTATLTGVTFAHASGGEGGALFASAAAVTATDVTFRDNVADLGGGASIVDSGAEFSRALFCGNAAEVGGALAMRDASVRWTNVRTVANAAGRGGGVRGIGGGRLVIDQAALVDDEGTATIDVSGPMVDVTGSIVRAAVAVQADGGSEVGGGYDLWDVGAVSAGDVAAIALPSDVDRFGDPQFAGDTSDCDAALWLMPTSPAVDAGDPARFDPDGTRADMGAYGGPDATLPDLDGDGATWSLDCDDADSTVYPGAPDAPSDGVDQDCDGADPCDGDGDGACAPEDCDDDDAAVRPGALDRPYDGVDQDCSGADECDLDRDGALDPRCGGVDCDDADPVPCASGWWVGGGGCATAPDGVGAFGLAVGFGALIRRRALLRRMG